MRITHFDALKTQENHYCDSSDLMSSFEMMILQTLCNSQGARAAFPHAQGGALGTGCCGLHSSLDSAKRVSSKCFSLRKHLPRKEVIQPHLPVRLPCYDFTPLTLHTFDASAPRRVRPAASGADDSGGVTGGVYKARERIHRGMLIRDY